jgi:hypothetical protein
VTRSPEIKNGSDSQCSGLALPPGGRKLNFWQDWSIPQFQKENPAFGAGFLLLRGHKQSGGGGRVIGPRLTTQFTWETHSPQKLFRKARIKIQTLAVRLAERLLSIGFISACLRSCGKWPWLQKPESAPENVPCLSWSAFSCFSSEPKDANNVGA